MASSNIVERHQLIGSINYLASLASDVRAIDPYLDTLRNITSTRPAENFTADDEQQLQRLRAQLEQYLVNQDPLRRFDPEVLEQKVYEHTAGLNHYAGLRKLLAAILGSSLAVTVAMLIVIFGGIAPSLQSQPQLPITVGLAVLYVGAVILFLQAVKGLNPQLKRAYGYICAGIIIIAALNAQFAILTKALEDTWWIQAWGFSPFFALNGFLFYRGMIVFARQFMLRSILLTGKTVGAVIVFTALVAFFAPHMATALPDSIYRLSVLSMGLCANLTILSCLIGVLTIQQLAPLYRSATRIMVIALGCFGVGAFLLTIIRLAWLDHNNPQAPIAIVGLSSGLIVMSGLLFLIASYRFNKAIRR